MHLSVSACISAQVQVREPLKCCISALVRAVDELVKQCTEFKALTADCVGGTGGWMNPGLVQRVSSTLQRDQCNMHFSDVLKVPPMQLKTPHKAVGASKTTWRYKQQAKHIQNHNG